jgi:uncharacterized protein YjbI with pentapeptide repeats
MCAYLSRTNVQRATWQGAKLTEAELQHADLTTATLQDANCQGTTLRGAHLAGADRTGAKHLTQDQVRRACVDEKTQLPPYLTPLDPCPVPLPR